MTQETATLTEKRLYRFEAFTLHNNDCDENDLSNYITNNTFVWCQYPDYESVKLLDDKEDAKWDNAEHWVTDCMDSGPNGVHASFKIFSATFGEITASELYWIHALCHLVTAGTVMDKYWPPDVFMMRELLAAYEAWVVEQSHPSLDFESVAV